MSENITLSNEFPQQSGEKGVKPPPESNEELIFAIGSGMKRKWRGEGGRMGVYKTFMKIFFDLLLWSYLRDVSLREKFPLPEGWPYCAAPDFWLTCETVCSLFSLCMKLMEFAVD